MNTLRSTLLVLVLTAACASGVETGFDRYQVILDRKPFGEAPPPDAGPQQPVIPPGESFAAKIRLSALLEDEDGIRVGVIMDNKDSFFLSVGDIESGVELVSASYEDEEAVLRKGSEMAVIKLTDGAVQALTPAQQKEKLDSRDRRMSYAERRRARVATQRPPEPPKPPPEPKLTGEDLQQHLKEYQMEVIRQGLPPLPIPLTPEMDDQLVAEGVLPPMEQGAE